jgi:hypothetical protein
MSFSPSKGSLLSIPLRRALSIFLLFSALTAAAQSNPPMNVQGRVLVDGVAFNGIGKFKFALVNGAGNQRLWTHDGSTPPSPFQPTNSITLNVVKGLYSVLLGDPLVPGMTNPLNPDIFANSDVRLRIWFDDGAHGFQQLAPDQRLGGVAYAYKTERATQAATLTGSVTIQQVPSILITNNAVDVDLTGSFTGDGSGLVGIRGSTPFQIANLETNIAVPNTGYLVTNPVQRVVQLPATVTMRVGDIVRVAGPGSWKVAQSPEQSIFASHFRGGVGATWIGRATSRNWNGITTSTNGVNLAAVVYNEFIYLSTNSGVSWVSPPVSPSKKWLSIASSGDGSRYVAGTENDFIFMSNDSGQGWSGRALPGARIWTGVASSLDGTNLVAVAWNAGPVYTSADAGETWQLRSGAGNRNWSAVASSGDGTNIVASTTVGVFVSRDRGSSWGNTLQGNFNAVASSQDGQRLVAGANGGTIYTSIDGGTNWVKRDGSGSHSWRTITCSADGAIIAATSPDGISISVDGGGAWALRATARDWRAITCTPDAGLFAAAAFGSQIFTSQPSIFRTTTVGVNGYLAGGEYSAVELQHAGNGKFFPLSSSGDIFAY